MDFDFYRTIKNEEMIHKYAISVGIFICYYIRLKVEDRPYFESIVNIEREKENPRKDYTKFEDVVPFISFFYDDYYETIIKETPFEFNPKFTKEEVRKWDEDFHIGDCFSDYDTLWDRHPFSLQKE